MANFSITLLMTIFAVAMTAGAYGQMPAAASAAPEVGPHCHTSAYTADCSVVEAAKAVLIVSPVCNPTGIIKIVGPYAAANGCACTIHMTAPTKADFVTYDTCEHLQPAYAALKTVPCPAGKFDGACNI